MKLAAAVFLFALAGTSGAAEVTIKNDSLSAGGSSVIEAGFVSGEMAAAWLTSPCDGDIRAVQIFWRSLSGGASDVIQGGLHIYREGIFPVPGTLAQSIIGPVLTDGVINEYRYLDENSTIPLLVPVSANEVVVVTFEFNQAPPGTGPSLAIDTDGVTSGRNAIFADLGSTNMWFANSALGVDGDWVIRAVVDCDVQPIVADVGVSMSSDPKSYVPGAGLDYTITIQNAGPATAGATVVDSFPADLEDVSWTCSASGGASCGLASGNGNIAQAINLPLAGEVVYAVQTDVNAATEGSITNTVTVVVNAPMTDPDTTNNSATLETPQASDLIFIDGFDGDLP